MALGQALISRGDANVLELRVGTCNMKKAWRGRRGYLDVVHSFNHAVAASAAAGMLQGRKMQNVKLGSRLQSKHVFCAAQNFQYG